MNFYVNPPVHVVERSGEFEAAPPEVEETPWLAEPTAKPDLAESRDDTSRGYGVTLAVVGAVSLAVIAAVWV